MGGKGSSRRVHYREEEEGLGEAVGVRGCEEEGGDNQKFSPRTHYRT